MRLFWLGLALLAFLLSSSWTVPVRLTAGELHPGLEAYLSTLTDDALVSVIVTLRDQADIQALEFQLKREKASRRERHERVVRALRSAASRSQPGLIDALEGAKSRGEVTGYTPYWISNLIVVQASKREILRLAADPAIEFIEMNFRGETIEPVTRGAGESLTTGIGVTPGLRAIHADRVWHELGFTGAGRLVANLDTGVQGQHVALWSRWRGRDPGVNWWEAWFDPLYYSQVPVDHNGHGTHVMGTITGLGAETADTIGVAWGAKWIACDAIDQGVGPAFDNDIIAAFEWFADPDGDPSTVDDVPDVVQNSWGIVEGTNGTPPYEACDDRWWAAIDDCEAAGVVVTWSAGNEGAWAYSLRSPADRASTPYSVFSIGAVDATDYLYPYPIADFSSRGPSDCGGPYATKPEVCAPGVNVYSCVRDGGYEGNWSGTSMAGPHVAGVVALMREAHPDLTVDQIKEVLMATAHDFGDPGDDNTYGRGFIDAWAAVVTVMNGVGCLQGRVTDAATGDPIPANLELLGTDRSMTADPGTGFYRFILPGDSTYTVRATLYGYLPVEEDIYAIPDDTTRLSLSLDVAPTGLFAGMVMDFETGLPLEGTRVEISDSPVDPFVTGLRGFFNLGDVPSGTEYRVQADATGYGLNRESISIQAGRLNLLAFPMTADFSDEMEAPPNGWKHGAITPGYIDQWQPSTYRNHTPGGSRSWKCGGAGGGPYANRVDAGLVTPEIDIQDGYRLYFWDWIYAETYGGPEAFDGGIVEISIDGGPFQQIAPVEGYPFQIRASDGPFPAGTPCFSGVQSWQREEFDLTGFSGAARFRFRFGSNGSISHEGWYIDDVVVAPDPPDLPVSILLLPTEESIQIGPDGGSFTYHMALVNHTDVDQTFDWWTDVSIGSEIVFGPIESHTETLGPGEVRTVRDIVRDVPARTPAGTFRFHGRLGHLPDDWDAVSSFEFTKTESGTPRHP